MIKIASKILIISIVLLTSVSCHSKQKPNIIFIFVDDMGYYDLSSYGATEVKTTQIDKLANEGVRFTDYYAAAPICSPSRAGLLTGCYPKRVGNAIWVHRPDSKSGLNPSEFTVAELFKENGYATACIGKWHLGSTKSLLPQNQGFDHYYGLLHNLDSYETAHFDDAGGTPIIRNGDVIERPADPAKVAKLYTDEAIQWIETSVEKKSKQPFFLYLPHTTLHTPLGVSKEFKGTSELGLYGDAIHELDYNVGRLMSKLEDLNIQDNTIVVYASDNGRGPGRNENQPLRGYKLSTYEAGLRVPCIIWGPGQNIPRGKEINELTHAMDWFPTLASFAGIKIKSDLILDGRDLSSLIAGDASKIQYDNNDLSINADVTLRRSWDPAFEWKETITQEEYLNAFFYHGSQGALSAVRSGKWKLFLTPIYTLYNLEDDPGERKPVRNSEVTSKLRGMAVLFQEEMRLNSRPAGDIPISTKK